MKKVLLLLGMLLPLAVYAQTATKSCFQSSCLPEIEAVKTITLKPIEIVGCRSIVKSYCCEVVTISCFSTHCPINVEEELAHEEELPEEEEQFTVLVFPNPASDLVNIRFEEAFSGKIRLLDARGISLIEVPLERETQISIPLTSQSGLHYLVAINRQGVQVYYSKLIVI